MDSPGTRSAMVRRADAGSLDHPGRGLGRLDLRRLRGPALHDLQDADAPRADRRRPGGRRRGGEHRLRGIPAGRGGRRALLRRAGRSLRASPDHGGDDPGLLGLLRTHGVRPRDVAGPSAEVPRRARHGRRMGGCGGAGRRDVPAPGPGRGRRALPRVERGGRRPGLPDRPDLRVDRLLRAAFLVGLVPSLAGPLDSGQPGRSEGTGRSGESGRARSGGVGQPGRTVRHGAVADSRPARVGTGHGRAGDVLGHLRLGPRAGGPDPRRRGDSRGQPVGLEPGVPGHELLGRTAGPAELRADGRAARTARCLRPLSRWCRDPRARGHTSAAMDTSRPCSCSR